MSYARACGNHPSPRSLRRGLELLELAVASPQGLAYGEVAKRLRLPNATVDRLLRALRALGHLEKDAVSGRYRPGPRLGALGAAEPLDARLRRLAMPVLADLRERTGNSAMLVHWTGRHAVVLERLLREDSLVLAEPGYVTQALHAAPWGIFCWPQARWEDDLRDRNRAAALGISRSWCDAERRRLRDHGFTRGRDHASKIRLAAPLERGGRVVGALAVGGTASSLPEARVPSVGAEVAAAARACSAML